MKKVTFSSKGERTPSDFFGAFCFVVLIAVVVYAAMTAA
jgi:hypothetical protein